MTLDPFIVVDFNEMFEDGAVDLRGSKDDLAKINHLTEGMKVVLTDQTDIEVDGRLSFDENCRMWVCLP